jgi:hypothetical protein
MLRLLSHQRALTQPSYKTPGGLGRNAMTWLTTATNYHSFTDTPRSPPTEKDTDSGSSNGSIKWIHVADASMRIEAILSGQAVAVCDQGCQTATIMSTDSLTRIIAVQPASDRRGAGSSFVCDQAMMRVVPVPHTVVVIKNDAPSSSRHPKRHENRSRRIGRLLWQYIIARRNTGPSPERWYGDQADGRQSICTLPESCCCLFPCCKAPPAAAVRVGQPIMC